MRGTQRPAGRFAVLLALAALLTGSGLGMTGVAVAAAAPAHGADQVPADLLPRLRERFPGIRFDHVDPSGFPALYEVYTDDSVVYTNASADWILMGPLVDARTQQNLSALRWDEHQRIDYAALPTQQAIRVVRGNGSREISVFADPMCPYCLELERTLDEVSDITVILYLLPLEEIHPGASLAAQRLWCSPDRAKAWLDWMRNNAEPAATDCADNPVNANLALADKLRINSTPTLFLGNGVRIGGAADKQTLLEALRAVPGPGKTDAGRAEP
jgi:thiol:disulfide interchange protein DsbC